MPLADRFAFLTRGAKKSIKDELTSTVWLGTGVEIPGLSTTAIKVFGEEPRLTFKKSGTCTLVIGDRITRARWRIKDDRLLIRGKSLKARADLSRLDHSERINSFTLYQIDNYMVIFDSETYLAELPLRMEKIKQEDKKRLVKWKDSLAVDLSTCTPAFVELLKSYSFQKFAPVTITEENKAELLKRYFAPLLSLGLQHTSWTRLYKLDAERLLDGYEQYEFRQKIGEEKGKRQEDEAYLVDYEQVFNFILPRLRWKPHPLLDEQAGLLRKSRRYTPEPPGFYMWLDKDPASDFIADLVEIWQSDKSTVIHMLYGNGKNQEDHAWFLMEMNPSFSCQTYIGGSAHAGQSF